MLFLLQTSSDFAMFNVQSYITKLEDLVDYDFPFERIKQVEKNLNKMAGDEETKEEPKIEEIKEEDEEEGKEEQKEKTLEEKTKDALEEMK